MQVLDRRVRMLAKWKEVLTMEGRGQIHVADQVVAVIAGVAANEVAGVFTKAGGFYEDLSKKVNRKTAVKGVEVTIHEDYTVIDLRVSVLFGTQIDRACRIVQEKVKEDVENITGLNVREVNIRVDGIVFRQEQNTAE